jgi:hypothetical protein
MRCAQCNNWIPDNGNFCQTCGRQCSPPLERGSKKGLSRGAVLAVVVLLITAVAVVLFVIIREHANTQGMPVTNTINRTADSAVAALQSRKVERVALISKPFEVPPLMHKSISFSATAGSVNARVEGWFRAAGGRGNDIEMTVRRDSENGQVVYATGRVTVGDHLNIPISPQVIYHVVFNNGFSMVSSKTISGDLQLVAEHY